MNQNPIPKFATEAEEAQWWYDQRHELTAKFQEALARGELKLRRLSSFPAIPTNPGPGSDRNPRGAD